ncbi:hypothetical protein AMAG_14532 [Allomyces macrogynus ATCC 38327]|uniref:Uncharacterized protein n=1 Tax=Allomyces macrogynus (strain ATCC 38327) TaxID=578462 RepID=A0A0L0T741_ALLM3|nr:hypothetical protein AMAG_14532 [Allomyces macrogynus ATCC 38327]|eukprot:KNE70394.1 hypothetical protein AMAG_14532 [Allomyces macrogynus ATCC 38327]
MSSEDLISEAYAQEEQGDRYANDPVKSKRYYQRALDLYLQARARTPTDTELTYNSARLFLVIADRTPDAREKLALLNQCLQLSHEVLVANPDTIDAQFNAAQACIWRAELVADEDGEGTTGRGVNAELAAQVRDDLMRAADLLTTVADAQRAVLGGETTDSEPAAEPAPATDAAMADGDSSDAGDDEITESSPITPAALIDTLLLHVECYELALDALADTDPDAALPHATQLLAEASALAASIPAEPSAHGVALTTAPTDPAMAILLADASYTRARADRHVARTGTVRADLYERALRALADVQTRAGARHLQAHCDAGDVTVAWAEAVAATVNPQNAVDDPAAVQVWQLLAQAAKHYLAAHQLDATRATVLMHLAETEWNRAAWSARVGQAERARGTLMKNAAVYADRAWKRMRMADAGAGMSEREEVLGLLCQALEALGMAADLARVRQIGP